MAKFMRRFSGRASDFRREEDGTASVEFVLWVPIFAVLFALMVDASTIFYGQSQILRVVQDADRHMSLRRFTTDDEVENYIKERLAAQNIYPRLVETTSSNAIVATLVTVHAGQFQYFGWFGALKNLELDTSHAHIRESITESDFASFALVATN